MAEREAAEDSAFGEWLYNLCRDKGDYSSLAQRFSAMWQQREELAKRDILPKETLADVLNFFTRVELDGWNTISRKFVASTQCALPMRPMYRVVLYFREESWPNHAKRGLYEAAFYFRNDGQTAKRFNAPDVASLFTPFFGRLRFCCVESGVDLQHIPIGHAFLDNLKAVNKEFCIAATFSTCQMSNVRFTEGVDPYDVITAFPSFRDIAILTLTSLVKHFGALDDALLSSLAAHAIWTVRVRDATENGRWARVLQQVGGSRITEDGVLDFAFGDYDDDEEGRALNIDPEVPLTSRFFEKLVAACRCKPTLRTEAIVRTHRVFDLAAWNKKTIGRLNEYRRDQYEHRPISEFHFAGLSDLTVRYVPADTNDSYKPAAVIHFWQNGEPTLGDCLLYTGLH